MNQGQTWFEQPRNGQINYTGQLSLLMRDIVARVPTLGFIDLNRVLVFARPGRSSADGAYASCHSLGLPVSDPGYFFWRDRTTGAITRRTEWFVTKSPEVYVGRQLMNYMISFALPRFTDQTLMRSRKRSLYTQGTPDWVAKLDTVVHELYHVDPEQTCLRRFTRRDGTESDALHNETYFEDVAVPGTAGTLRAALTSLFSSSSSTTSMGCAHATAPLRAPRFDPSRRILDAIGKPSKANRFRQTSRRRRWSA